MVVDGGTKVVRVAQVLQATVKLGLPQESVAPIGVLLLACTAIYVIPQTAVFGAILLTGLFWRGHSDPSPRQQWMVPGGVLGHVWRPGLGGVGAA